jgi:alkyl hydroperoxide reductase subunit AhpF
MSLLNDHDAAEIKKLFGSIGGPVKLVVFSSELTNGDLCRQNEQLVREVAALDDRITVEVLNPNIERDRAAAYHVDQVPAIVVEGARDYGLRFLGVPSGYEFSNLVDAIIIASTGEASLSAETKEALAGLTDDVDIKVFSTPT